MRLAFRSIALFNVATALWLSVMFLILRHADFAAKAAVAFGIAAFCAFALYASRSTALPIQSQPVPSWMRAAAMSGSLILGAGGALAIYTDLQPNASFEGFTLIIGAAWIAQAATAAVTFAKRRSRVTA